MILIDENDRLHAEVERLTRERGALAATVSNMTQLPVSVVLGCAARGVAAGVAEEIRERILIRRPRS